ncbi:MAG: Hpt domain-containing protein, partial [Bacteroidota bacterium]
LSKLHQALQTDDRQGTKDLAHRLKSSYKMMGLHAQVELLQGMEDHCFTDDAQPSHLLPAMQRLLSDSDLAYQQLHQALDNL